MQKRKGMESTLLKQFYHNIKVLTVSKDMGLIAKSWSQGVIIIIKILIRISKLSNFSDQFNEVCCLFATKIKYYFVTKSETCIELQ